ncbi:uncharacterized protein BP5553_10534 [Venustampulla echinocandica]|uniref:Uncharacterized protein n=1 Tax=Venustampulla echinocandica TaxID=2656787 RepID=A0A370T8V1_9HELO|nr:uncharacterized protein BP5553_10534 [Venustampulla echinocandica]RDL29907.1 hypothetical protein BP5553_10534 [Venustampulla echinocandica]
MSSRNCCQIRRSNRGDYNRLGYDLNHLDGLGGRIGSAIGAISGSFGVATPLAPPDPRAVFKESLADYFEEQCRARGHHAQCFRRGGPSQTPKAALTDADSSTNVVKFFDQGKFLPSRVYR